MRHRGFTIVELLIVIVVIAILAAITVVAFNGVQNRGIDASVQSDIKNLATKIKLFYADNAVYPIGLADFNPLGIKVNKSAYDHYYNGTAYYNLVYCYTPSVAPTSFAIIGYSKSKNWMYTSGGSLKEFTGVKTGSFAACSAAGVNLANSNDRFWFYDTGNWQAVQ